MNKKIISGRSTRTKIFALLTALLIVTVLALGIGLNYFVVFDTAYIDLTPEGLYTLRRVMVDECRPIFVNEDGSLKEKGITITFCSERDALLSNTVTRAVYYTAIALSKQYDNFNVEAVDVSLHPNKVAQYRTTSLTEITPTDVIVSHGDRYRILSAESFWRKTSETLYSYDGEYKLASVMMSLTLVNQPKAYFVTDHGESYYDVCAPESERSIENAYLYDLLVERGFGVGTVSLSDIVNAANAAGTVPTLPEDCVLLIINDPRTDFSDDPLSYDKFNYVSETELLDRYMLEGRGSIVVSKDYAVSLPVFEGFLREWGIQYGDNLVKDTASYIEDGTGGATFVGEYNTSESSYGYSIYKDYVTLSTSPRMILSNTGSISCTFGDGFATSEAGTGDVSRIFAPFLYTSASAVEYGRIGDEGDFDYIASDAGVKTVAAISGRQALNTTTGDYTYSYVFCAASPDFFSSDILGNTSYANYDIVSAALQSIARLDTYASSALGGISVNNYVNFAGKVLVSTEIKDTQETVLEWHEDGTSEAIKTNYALETPMKVVYTVIIALVPLAVTAFGIVVRVKRKFL